MADIIDLSSRFKSGHNLIAVSPLEFRKGEWLSGNAILCTREESAKLEAQRKKSTPDRPLMTLVPHHRTLEGGCHYTCLWLFRFREDEKRMRRLYRLAGLMECVTGAPSPVLRTDLVRRFFKIINEEREKLNVSWRGNVRSFLLPLRIEHYDPAVFLEVVSNAPSLKELLGGIERETDSQFDILAANYVFYVPSAFLSR
ncbi:MAG: hypothetical protein M0Z81_10465 [Deltaproteobacteria bacterium]|jgi:hypothetical protein|nr:hypothetical protein [Deltaproteobacteria bacterium]